MDTEHAKSFSGLQLIITTNFKLMVSRLHVLYLSMAANYTTRYKLQPRLDARPWFSHGNLDIQQTLLL